MRVSLARRLGAAALGVLLASSAATVTAAPPGSPAPRLPDAPIERPAPPVAVTPSTSGEYVVGFEETDRASIERAVRAAGATVKEVSPTGERMVVEIGGSSAGGARILENRVLDLPEAEYVVPVSRAELLYTPSDTYFPQQWSLGATFVPAAWDIATGSSDVKIAIIDTGIDLTHPEFAGRIDTANDYDFVRDDAVADDEEGHGTHVAGIAAAAIDNVGTVGVAPGCTILPVKAFDKHGYATNYDIADAIAHAVWAGADVISMSFDIGVDPNDPLSEDGAYAVIDEIANALEADVICVASAGNSGETSYPEVGLPAALPGVISVGSCDPDLTRSSFSSYGPIDPEWFQGVTIGAPGSDILSSAIGTTTPVLASGTSMAAPFVAGTFGLMKSRFPTLASSRIESQVLNSAQEVDQDGDGTIDPGPDWVNDELGYGVVRPDRALARQPEANDTPSGASRLPASSTRVGDLEWGDAWDFYLVDIEKGGVLEVRLEIADEADLDLMVAPMFGNPTPDDTGFAGTENPVETMRYVAPATGRYALGINRFSGESEYELVTRVKNPVPYLTKPTARSTKAPYYDQGATLKRYRTYKWTGYLKPKHAGGGEAVYINIKQYRNGAWKHVKNVTARNYKRYSFTEYQAYFPLGPGRFKLTPVAVEDSLHARTVGTPNYVTVK